MDFKEGVVRIPGTRTKNGRPAIFPFSSDPRLAELLQEQKARTEAWAREHGTVVTWVFWHATKNGAVKLSDCRKFWHTARIAAGVPWLLIHDLRRSRQGSGPRLGCRTR